MTILRDVFTELLAMFVGDIQLAAVIVIMVAVAAGLIDLSIVEPLAGGGVLLVGCLAVVIGAVCRSARPQRTDTATSKHAHHQFIEVPRASPLRRIVTWLERMHQRRALKELEDRLLDDIGVSKDAAEAESRRLD